MLLVSLFLLVILPSALWGAYLWTRATDQFSSTVGFSVRREEGMPSMDMFGGIFGGSSSGTASDTDILYEFIRSPDLVQRTDAALDIRTMFSRPWPRDFVFTFDPEGTIVANIDGGTMPNQLRADGKGNVFVVNKSRGEDDPEGDRVWRITPVAQ